ncbi:uncharacterized protein FFB20_06467 [Fusarium fujikuroi]|nr:uncharacterized protein FFB20_06467 [Fusarium fujikuroi]
MPTKRFHW